MRITIFLILLVTLQSCYTHTFYRADKVFTSDQSKERKINTADFKDYYRVVYRYNERRETAYFSKPEYSDSRHITDVQHLLVNEQAKEFILISYVPVSRRGRKDNFYMDKYLSDYEKSINAYYLNNIVWGSIANNSFLMRFPPSRKKRKPVPSRENKNLAYNYTNSGDVQITSMAYPARKDSTAVDLGDVFPRETLLFRKMPSHGITFYGATATPAEDLTDTITFSKHYHKSETNLVIFQLKNSYTTKQGFVAKKIYFKQRADRFKFSFPR